MWIRSSLTHLCSSIARRNPKTIREPPTDSWETCVTELSTGGGTCRYSDWYYLVDPWPERGVEILHEFHFNRDVVLVLYVPILPSFHTNKFPDHPPLYKCGSEIQGLAVRRLKLRCPRLQSTRESLSGKYIRWCAGVLLIRTRSHPHMLKPIRYSTNRIAYSNLVLLPEVIGLWVQCRAVSQDLNAPYRHVVGQDILVEHFPVPPPVRIRL